MSNNTTKWLWPVKVTEVGDVSDGRWYYTGHEGVVDFLKKECDISYKPILGKDVSSCISKRAKVLLAEVYAGHFIDDDKYDDFIDEVSQNVTENRKKRWMVLREIIKENKCGATVDISHIPKKAFCETYSILECLPAAISSRIPLEKIIWVRDEKDKSNYMHDISKMDVGDYSPDTIELLKEILSDVIDFTL